MTDARLQKSFAIIGIGTSAVGFATAALFVRHGAKVHLLGPRMGELASAADALGPTSASWSLADFTRPSEIEDGLAQAARISGHSDILIACADYRPVSLSIRPALLQVPAALAAERICLTNFMTIGARTISRSGSIVLNLNPVIGTGSPLPQAFSSVSTEESTQMKIFALELGRAALVNTGGDIRVGIAQPVAEPVDPHVIAEANLRFVLGESTNDVTSLSATAPLGEQL